MYRSFSLLLLALALLSGVANAQDSLNVTRLGQISFPPSQYCNGVTVLGSYAYLGSGNIQGGLYIVNISNPAAPFVTGFCPIDNAGNIVISGAYAYVAAFDFGLRIVNISNPQAPFEVGHFDDLGAVDDVDVSGAYAYVADFNNALRVINISNPAAPFQVGYCNIPGYGAFAEGVIVSGSYAYVAAYNAGLRIINVANPANPVEVGYYNTPGEAYSVAVSGSYAYVADGLAGLRIINISNPAAPVEVGYYNTPGWTLGVAVSEPYVYLADGGSGLHIVNVVDPTVPVEVGYYDTPGDACDVAVSDFNVYVADGFIYPPTCYFGIYQFSPPNVIISLTPINPPIQIPASGGSFNYNAAIANSGISPAIIDAWIMVRLPNQTWYSPVLGPLSLTIQVGGSATRQRQQTVPATAPPGNYWYQGRVGYYPSAIIDSSGFSFTKLGSGGWGLDAGGWANTGEDFGEKQGVQLNAPTPPMTSDLCLTVSPNPANPKTAISYELRAASFVNLRIYDTAGRLVVTLVDGWREAGDQRVTFDGSALASGVYLYRLEAGGATAIGKMVLLK